MQAAASEAAHNELAEKINQVAILRESNATLRSDCDTYSKRARQLEAELRKVTAELEPIKEKLRVSQAEVEAKDQQIKLLENESRRWQERNTQLLTKVCLYVIDASISRRSTILCSTTASTPRRCSS